MTFIKWVLICIIFLAGKTSFAQVRDTKSNEESRSVVYLGLIDEYWPPKNLNYDSLLVVYADSINNYTTGKLPDFLFNECLDWLLLVRSTHGPGNFRWDILEKMTNKNNLKLLLANNDKRLKKKCRIKAAKHSIYVDYKMSRMSFYQLIKKRYEEM